jgi:N6-adenosine-specific RNA methylase IME4
MADGLRLVSEWGFGLAAILVWSKPPKGHVGTFVSSTEFVLFGRRGSLAAKRKQLGTCFTWSRGAHSQKPEAFLDLVEQVSPGPYLELFARRQRLGWDTWGDEALEHVTLAAAPSVSAEP